MVIPTGGAFKKKWLVLFKNNKIKKWKEAKNEGSVLNAQSPSSQAWDKRIKPYIIPMHACSCLYNVSTPPSPEISGSYFKAKKYTTDTDLKYFNYNGLVLA